MIEWAAHLACSQITCRGAGNTNSTSHNQCFIDLKLFPGYLAPLQCFTGKIIIMQSARRLQGFYCGSGVSPLHMLWTEGVSVCVVSPESFEFHRSSTVCYHQRTSCNNLSPTTWGANTQLRTALWATGAFGAAVPSRASPQCESVSATWSSGPVTVESPVPAWSNGAAAGSTETTRVATVDSAQVYKYNTPWFCCTCSCSLLFYLIVYEFLYEFIRLYLKFAP